MASAFPGESLGEKFEQFRVGYIVPFVEELAAWGEKAKARESYARANDWISKHPDPDLDLPSLRAEAAVVTEATGTFLAELLLLLPHASTSAGSRAAPSMKRRMWPPGEMLVAA